MRRLSAIGLMALSLTACSPPATPGDIRGVWRAASGNIDVNITPCGAALCGTVTEVLANNATQAGAMAGPAAAGLTILSDLKASGGAGWTGHIFNRQNGKTYDCQVSLLSDGRLRVRPYVLVPAIGKTQIWTRAGQ